MENTDSTDLYLTGEGWQEWTNIGNLSGQYKEREIGGVKDETDVPGL